MLIQMWAGPRNISTAMMYSFAQRPNTIVFDEPLYAHYLTNTSLAIADRHPGKAEILKSQSSDGQLVLTQLQQKAQAAQEGTLFCKQMTQHLLEIDLDALFTFGKHFLLIRDPYDVLISFNKVIEKPTLDDIGIAKQYALFERALRSGMRMPVVDSIDILKNPEVQLRSLCEQLNIPFDKSMLNWPLGPKSYDGVWAKYWYANTHASSGFTPYTTRTKQELPAHLLDVYNEAKPYYDKLYKFIQLH